MAMKAAPIRRLPVPLSDCGHELAYIHAERVTDQPLL